MPLLRPTYGVCTAVRREGLLLVEWIEYHSMIGIKNFYVYIPLPEVMDSHEALVTYSLLEPYRHSATIKLHILYQQHPRDGFNPQAQAMDECYITYATQNDWLFFFDVDEFLAFSLGDHLDSILSSILRYLPPSNPQSLAAVCIRRVNIFPAHPFDNPVVRRPPDSLLTEVANRSTNDHAKGKIAAYTQRSDQLAKECHFKSVTDEVIYFHNCFGHSRVPVILTNGMSVPPSDTHCRFAHPNNQEKLVLYHYFVRTCAEWRELLLKRNEWNKDRGFPLNPKSSRFDPMYCTKSSDESLAVADWLLRHLPELSTRVREHPLWGQSISFF